MPLVADDGEGLSVGNAAGALLFRHFDFTIINLGHDDGPFRAGADCDTEFGAEISDAPAGCIEVESGYVVGDFHRGSAVGDDNGVGGCYLEAGRAFDDDVDSISESDFGVTAEEADRFPGFENTVVGQFGVFPDGGCGAGEGCEMGRGFFREKQAGGEDDRCGNSESHIPVQPMFLGERERSFEKFGTEVESFPWRSSAEWTAMEWR